LNYIKKSNKKFKKNSSSLFVVVFGKTIKKVKKVIVEYMLTKGKTKIKKGLVDLDCILQQLTITIYMFQFHFRAINN